MAKITNVIEKENGEMKNSAIREIFYGNRCHELMKPSEEYFKLLDKSIKLNEEVRKKLSCEILEIYNKAVEATEAVHYEELCEIYEEGFSFGLLIGMQACDKI